MEKGWRRDGEGMEKGWRRYSPKVCAYNVLGAPRRYILFLFMKAHIYNNRERERERERE